MRALRAVYALNTVLSPARGDATTQQHDRQKHTSTRDALLRCRHLCIDHGRLVKAEVVAEDMAIAR